MSTPPHVPNRPTPVHPGTRPRIVQGSFLGNRLRLPAHLGAVQPSARGPATQLPPALLSLHIPGKGQQLPEAVQRKMEAFFKADFSDVRVHVGNEASSIGALAFTCGSDLYFARGQYNPNLLHGQRLIGHELTHVLQQREGRVRNPFGSGMVVVQDPGLEAEAERMAIRVGQPFIQKREAPQGSLTLSRNEDFQARIHQLKGRYRNPMAPLQRSKAPVKSLQTKSGTRSKFHVPDSLRFLPRDLTGLIQRYEELSRSTEDLEDERAVRKRLLSETPRTTCNFASIIFKVGSKGDEVNAMSQGPDLPDADYHAERMAIMRMCGKVGAKYLPANAAQTRKNLNNLGVTDIFIFTEWQPCSACHEWLGNFLNQDEILYYAERLEYRGKSKEQRAENFQRYLEDLKKESPKWVEYEF